MKFKSSSRLSIERLYPVPSVHLRHVRSAIYLFPYDEIPEHMQDNAYITAGYRCYLSAKQCLKSIFVISNEVVNIWTHLFMVFVWLLILLYDQLYALPKLNSSIEDHFIHLTYVLCVQICMVASAGYHTFICHSLESVSLKWYRVDLVGITTGVLGCYIPGLHYGFWCFAATKLFYLFAVVLMIAFSATFMTNPRYLSRSWQLKRLIHFVALSLFGIVPAAHWVLVSNSEEVHIFFPNIVSLYLILGTAFLFYISKFPEKCMPGKFNLVGHSHNIWHVLTAASFVYWRNAMLNLMSYRIQNGCR